MMNALRKLAFAADIPLGEVREVASIDLLPADFQARLADPGLHLLQQSVSSKA